MPKRKKSARATLLKKADMLFSKVVRLRHANAHGYVACYTCGDVYYWRDGLRINCGHYVSRKHHATRYDEDNTRPQCVACNKYGRLHGPGESVTFREHLIAEGVDADAVTERAREVKHWTELELQKLCQKLSDELKSLQAVKG